MLSMENYEHAVFFKATDLTRTELEKISTYFRVRRRSGGGECEPVEKVRGDSYRIAFRDKKAQERVLAQKDHVIPLPGRGEFKISLSLTDETEDNKKSLPPSPADNQVQAAGKQVEKIFEVDSYLLRFLSESPKAGNDLKSLLSPLSSSFSLRPEDGEVTVETTVTPGQDKISVEKWEAKVEDVFNQLLERYNCYFELDPERLSILPQIIFSDTDNLKVYTEGKSMTVLVGDTTEIQKRVQKLDALQKKQQVQEEHNMTELQYNLVKDQLEQEIKVSYPAVKVTWKGPGTLVLRGPDRDVHEASTKLKELISGIQEERIQMSPALIDFIKTSGAIQSYQGRFQQTFRSPVALEIDIPHLVLFSRSRDVIWEAVSIVQRELCEESVPIEKSEGQSSGIDKLKDALNQALQQANREGTKVVLSYEQGTGKDPRKKVQLVGYNEKVETLKAVLQDYNMNHADIHDSVPLPLPELVDNFSEFLGIAGVKAGTVKLTTTRSPSPCVHLSGPQCLVKDLQEDLEAIFVCLESKKFVVKGPGAQRYFQAEGKNNLALWRDSLHVLIIPSDNGQTSSVVDSDNGQTSSVVDRDMGSVSLTILASTPSSAQPTSISGQFSNIVRLEIVIGGLEDQQVDVLIAPMLNANLGSTRVGTSLLRKAGKGLQKNFDQSKGNRQLNPGEVLEVTATPQLGCSKVFFIECLPWSAANRQAEQALHSGLEQALDLCGKQAWTSVAIPVIGPGLVLNAPKRDAAGILAKEIGRFGLSGNTGSVQTIRIPILSDYPDSEEIFQHVSQKLSAQMVDHRGQAVFESLTTDLDEITLSAGGIQLHLIFGDITNETTDVVVNTTDFRDFQTGVCKDILTVAGPQVQTSLTGANVKKGEIFTSQAGGFPCKAIMHVCGERDAGVIQNLARDIVLLCERSRYTSVSIPAICAGKGGMDPRVVAHSILQGVSDAVSNTSLQQLRTVRLILFRIRVFQAFQAEALQLFGTPLETTDSVQPTPIRPPAQATLSLPPARLTPSARPDFSSLPVSLRSCQSSAVFMVIGLTPESVTAACEKLRRDYEMQCSKRTITADDLRLLDSEDLDQLLQQAATLDLQIEDGSNGWAVTGLRDGVNAVADIVQGALRRQVKNKEQENVFAQVVWCIQGQRGDWERLPKEGNHKLERGDVSGPVVDGQGKQWIADVGRMQAQEDGGNRVTKLKRLENLPDFIFPLYWDSMATGQYVQVFTLHPSSAEYGRVKSDFKRTATDKTVLKIERIQNIHFRRAYEARKTELEEKNGPPVGAGEKILYHGTTAENCKIIQSSNFDRGYAGQNAARYGQGTYFAVDASYSTNPAYARPAADGSQLMFVARVLTGYYTLGQSSFRAPPARSPEEPENRFDSVVDNAQRPQMFVVFHDSQAYPDYLITFK